MHIARIFHPGSLELNHVISLSNDQVHHLTHVLKVKVDATLILFNSKSGEFVAKIINIQRKEVLVRILDQHLGSQTESSLHIHLIQGLSRSERMDYSIQKAVELGVSEITPLITERCNIKLNKEHLAKRQDHWEKIVISACEQSGRTTIPQINPVQFFKDCFVKMSGINVICSLTAKPHPLPIYSPGSVNLLIGPEGGFTLNEMSLAVNEYQCFELSLGPRILRTETATVVAMTLLQYQWGDLT